MTDAGVIAPIHKNPSTTLPRLYNFISATRFKDTNLLGRLYPKSSSVSLSHWGLPGGVGSWEDWQFEYIIKQVFTPVELGNSYGPTWSTHWFKIEFQVPAEWYQEEVRFRWVSGTEATLWSADGKVLQGLSTGTDTQLRTEYVLTHSFNGDTSDQVLYVEMAANRMFGASTGDQIDPPDPNLYFTVSTAELVVMDKTVYKLIRDIEILHQIADNLMEDDPRGYMAMHSGNQMVNLVLEGRDTEAVAIADEYFSKGNGERVHTLAAIGNCHIDSAWLWPFSETKRKIARSFSSQLQLMKDYPGFIFVASQGQQWAWCKEYYPELFDRIKLKVSDGTFLPVGSTWTEMDGNIPSGESFIRQFFYGLKFFKDECGYECQEFWLPDTFGYNGQIPALMKHVGLSRFLTQKMSWSLVNKFPHHNFTWEGIDGSTVLAHFPPGDSYSMYMTICGPWNALPAEVVNSTSVDQFKSRLDKHWKSVRWDGISPHAYMVLSLTGPVEEALRTENNLRDKGRVSTSAFLFGYGDGGGGPTQDMLERQKRLADVDGVPKLVLSSPNELFSKLEDEQHNMMRWAGELFLELHNGTYTSQASMKQLCRYAEFRLRDAEYLLSGAVAQKGAAAGALLADSLTTLETAWKKVLLNQFHDVLPGSGIAIIYEDAKTYYSEAIAAADEVFDSSAEILFGTSTDVTAVAMNTLQWPRREVLELTTTVAKRAKRALGGSKRRQQTRGSEYVLVDVFPFSVGPIEPASPDADVTVVENNGSFTMTNSLITATISPYGQVTSLKVNGNDRDVFSNVGGGNQVTLYDDEPLYWDAWDVMDYHLETGKVLNTEESTNVTNITLVESGPLVGRLRWSLDISDVSTMTQEIVLTADCPYLTFDTTVDWHESHKILKTNFATNIFTRNASYEIQFGFIERPTHMNTSWDTARYEVCGHKWADLSEPDFGVAVLNDSKFGWEGRGNVLSLSLLKAPKAPDDNCDMRTHTFKYALFPHQGTLVEANVMRRGYEFNNLLRTLTAPTSFIDANANVPMFEVQGDGIVLHTIKPANDGTGDFILRFFECNGCQSSATLTVKFVCSAAFQSNGLEAIGDPVQFDTNVLNQTTTVNISLKPFNIYALRLNK